MDNLLILIWQDLRGKRRPRNAPSAGVASTIIQRRCFYDRFRPEKEYSKASPYGNKTEGRLEHAENSWVAERTASCGVQTEPDMLRAETRRQNRAGDEVHTSGIGSARGSRKAHHCSGENQDRGHMQGLMRVLRSNRSSADGERKSAMEIRLKKNIMRPEARASARDNPVEGTIFDVVAAPLQVAVQLMLLLRARPDFASPLGFGDRRCAHITILVTERTHPSRGDTGSPRAP
ncbi:hypothetical protein EDB84DRAFT_1445718 [Lactarius hengduanensis]|nr:hypothetical protein EDB84DRAFT_1445718 [Lactarius hengduanensis]